MRDASLNKVAHSVLVRMAEDSSGGSKHNVHSSHVDMKTLVLLLFSETNSKAGNYQPIDKLCFHVK